MVNPAKVPTALVVLPRAAEPAVPVRLAVVRVPPGWVIAPDAVSDTLPLAP